MNISFIPAHPFVRLITSCFFRAGRFCFLLSACSQGSVVSNTQSKECGLLNHFSSRYDWAALASCFLVILLGLSSTLMIVSVFRSVSVSISSDIVFTRSCEQQAIPALPVSIGLGVCFYLLTRIFIIPYIQVLCSEGVLV